MHFIHSNTQTVNNLIGGSSFKFEIGTTYDFEF